MYFISYKINIEFLMCFVGQWNITTVSYELLKGFSETPRSDAVCLSPKW